MLFRSWHTYSIKFKIFSSANKQRYQSFNTITSDSSDSASNSSISVLTSHHRSSISIFMPKNSQSRARKSVNNLPEFFNAFKARDSNNCKR